MGIRASPRQKALVDELTQHPNTPRGKTQRAPSPSLHLHANQDRGQGPGNEHKPTEAESSGITDSHSSQRWTSGAAAASSTCHYAELGNLKKYVDDYIQGVKKTKETGKLKPWRPLS
ncbi:hypothetical protein MRX96_057595 [Rhipicephalus microplus]